MGLNKTITSSVYVVINNKVLVHKHKKYNTLFPLGEKMNENEVPHETAIREVCEKSELNVELYNRDSELNLGRIIQLHSQMHTLVENVDFIYFARAISNQVKLQKDENKELYWFIKEEVENHDDIKPYVKVMALDALRILRE